MLHEAVESSKGSLLPMFIFCGIVLLGSTFVFRQANIPFYIALGIFGGLVSIAVLADHLIVTGAIPIMGREVDYEEIIKAAGVLFAAIALGIRSTQSLQEVFLKQFQGESTAMNGIRYYNVTPSIFSTPLPKTTNKALEHELLTTE